MRRAKLRPFGDVPLYNLGLGGALALALACCHPSQRAEVPRRDPHRAAMSFLAESITAWPTPGSPHALVVSSGARKRVSIYDNALVAMVLLREGRPTDAGRILTAMTLLQKADGSLPFSFLLSSPLEDAYVRAGAMAWVGYAAVEFANASRDLPGRESVVVMAHRIASYLLQHRVTAEGDPRRDLVLGGSGSFRYQEGARGVEEIFVPGEVEWASVEHNIDAFFFLKALARLSGQSVYRTASDAIARALSSRAFWPPGGQLARGFHPGGIDSALALDCASWGALFLLAAGRRLEAETSFAAADIRYASGDGRGLTDGHKPYAHAPLYANKILGARFARSPDADEWDEIEAIWPEGSAGVALAALRLGFRRRAMAILDRLEVLRAPDGALPVLTTAVPFEFETGPSIAGTAWVELVRFELESPREAPRFWSNAEL